MQSRGQYLFGGLLTALVVWQAGGWVSSAVFGPFETRRGDLTRLQKSVTEKEDKLLMLARANKSLKDWKLISLPPDDNAKSRQPTALNAQRLYIQWLTDLAQLS